LARKILAKCPKCGDEKEVNRMHGPESAGGDCDDCKIHFVTATWWREN
jgi:hypothetical protein